MSYRGNDDELSKKDLFLIGMILATIVTSVIWYYGNKYLNSLPPVPAQPIAPEVKVEPKIVSSAEVVGVTKLPYKGRVLVEVKTKSGFTCFVGVHEADSAPMSTSCVPSPVKQELHM